MNWLAFALFAYVGLAAQAGLRPLLAIGETSPKFLIIVGVFIALMSAPNTALWAMLILGVLADLQPGPIQGGVIIGPHALGYLLGGVVVMQFRTLVFRDSLITVAAMVLVSGLFVELCAVAIYALRGMPWLLGEPIENWRAADALFTRFLSLVYTTIAAAPIGWLLLKSAPLWRFPSKRAERHYHH